MAVQRDSQQSLRDSLISQLIAQVGGSSNQDLIEQIIHTALRLIDDGTDRGDIKVMNSAFKEMRYAAKVFAPYRHVRKVSMFGSARAIEGQPEYGQAKAFSRRMVEEGFMVITGAGGGIMRAGQEGAGADRSFGINIRLPFEQVPNDVIQNDPKLINFKYFFTRKLTFVKESHAILLLPGGFGTHDEAFEALTLSQTGKSVPLPIVFLDRPGGSRWSSWLAYVRDHLLEPGHIAPEDMDLFLVTDEVEKAVEEIVGFYRVYHSSRYVNENLVIRLNHPIGDRLLDDLNAEFEDILESGRIRTSRPLPEESDEAHLRDLQRLVLHFNRRNFGRLRRMIDRLNGRARPVS